MDDAIMGIATAIASGAGGSIGASGAASVARLISALRARFRGDPGARGTLEIAVESPGSQVAGEELVAVLRARTASDPGFGEWLLSQWLEVAPQLDAGKQTNVISGTVKGNVIQARDIQGGIHFNHG
jgi:hypothetical protein